MDRTVGISCCVCGTRDARALVDVELAGGARVTLCGSHELMHRRAPLAARSESELVALMRDRRGRRDRRTEGDELGTALTAAFSRSQRSADRRRP